MPNTLLRNLTAEDLEDALDLSRLAGWNQHPDDWRRLLALAPAGCFCIETDGRVAATSTLVCYQDQLAWIGMVLTHPAYRRRGFAHQLVSCAIAHAHELGVKTIKLDATDLGRPLYEALGFKPEQPVERWASQAFECSGNDQSPELAAGVMLDLDREACGYDRSLLLSSLSLRNTSCEVPDGYVLCRPGLLNAYVGPCIAAKVETAERLIIHSLKQCLNAGWFWDLLPVNTNSVKLAESFGFKRVRSLTRMVLGAEQRGREDLIYAIAGLEFG